MEILNYFNNFFEYTYNDERKLLSFGEKSIVILSSIFVGLFTFGIGGWITAHHLRNYFVNRHIQQLAADSSTTISKTNRTYKTLDSSKVLENSSKTLLDKSNVLSDYSKALDITSKALDDSSKVLENSSKTLLDKSNVLSDSSKALDITSKALDDSSKVLENSSKTLLDKSNVLSDSSKALDITSRALDDSSKVLENSSKTLDKSNVLSDSSRALDSTSGALDDSSKALENSSKTLLDKSNVLSDSSRSLDITSKVDSSKTLEDYSKALDSTSKALDDSSNRVNSASSILTAELEKVIGKVKEIHLETTNEFEFFYPTCGKGDPFLYKSSITSRGDCVINLLPAEATWEIFHVWPGSIVSTNKGKGIILGVCETNNYLWIKLDQDPGGSYWDNVNSNKDFDQISLKIISKYKPSHTCQFITSIVHKMFEQKVNADLPISFNNQEILTHTFYLKACSPMLNNLLGNRFKEASATNIDIDFSPLCVDLLIHYLYKGDIKLNKNNIVQIYELADYFLIKELKLSCLKFFETSTNRLISTLRSNREFDSAESCWNNFGLFPGSIVDTTEGEACVFGMGKKDGCLYLLKKNTTAFYLTKINSLEHLRKLKVSFRSFLSNVEMSVKSDYPIKMLRQIFDQKLGCDVTFSIEGQSISAHTAYLSLCSPYFKDLISSTDSSRPIPITDCSFEIFNSVLTYLYTGDLSTLKNKSKEMLKIAKKLSLPLLEQALSY